MSPSSISSSEADKSPSRIRAISARSYPVAPAPTPRTSSTSTSPGHEPALLFREPADEIGCHAPLIRIVLRSGSAQGRLCRGLSFRLVNRARRDGLVHLIQRDRFFGPGASGRPQDPRTADGPSRCGLLHRAECSATCRPGCRRSTLRTSLGRVVWPFEVTVDSRMSGGSLAIAAYASRQWCGFSK